MTYKPKREYCSPGCNKWIVEWQPNGEPRFRRPRRANATTPPKPATRTESGRIILDDDDQNGITLIDLMPGDGFAWPLTERDARKVEREEYWRSRPAPTYWQVSCECGKRWIVTRQDPSAL